MRKPGRWMARDGRWAYVAIVLTFLGSTFAAGTHWLTVPHRLCEVHGTVEHGLAEATRPANPCPPGPVVREGERSHEECALGPFARTEAIPLPHVELRGTFVAEEGGRVLVPAAPSASVPLFLLAPSRSPPA